MKIPKDLQPSGIFEFPDLSFPRFVQNALIRCFFEPRIKEMIGWLGVAERRGGPPAITVRIACREGVYGLFYLGWENEGDWARKAYFDLKYFPGPEEPVFESFSAIEQITRLDPSFERWLRTAPDGLDPLSLAFPVGRVCLCIDEKEENLFLSLWSPDRWREIPEDGLRLPGNDGIERELVPPGGVDRNVPSFAYAWSFFDRLVWSCAYLLEQAPLCVHLQSRPGQELIRRVNAEPLAREFSRTRDKFLTVGFGPPGQPGRGDMRGEWVRGFRPDHWPPLPDPDTRIILSATGPENRCKLNPGWWGVHSRRVYRSKGGSPAHTPPLIVVTGFLGSGKTTLVNQIVEWKALGHYRFAAVIQNDFGEVAVDSRLADGAFSTVEITEGCVCCSHSGELTKAVRKICAEYQPDVIIVETTGLSDPENLVEELPRLAALVRLDSLVTVVDASNLDHVLTEYGVVKKQIEAADLILINKLDLVPEGDVDRLSEVLSALNERANVVSTVGARINPELLFSGGNLFLDRNTLGSVPTASQGHDLHAESCVNAHDHLHADRVQTATVEISGLLERSAFEGFLHNLPRSVYRVKGVVAFRRDPVPQLLQYVAGRYEISPFPETDLARNVLVFIGRDVSKARLQEALERCVIEDEEQLP